MSKLYDILNSVITRVKKVETTQPDLSQNDPNAADYVKNRTHYEAEEIVNEPLNITWDGNTEGLVSVDNYFYKVSDAVLTDEQIKSGTVGAENNEPLQLSAMFDSYAEAGLVTDELAMLEVIVFCRKAGAIFNNFTFPEVGIYFGYEEGLVNVTSLTTTEPVEHTKTVLKKLDKKFLPDDIGGVKYVTIGENDYGVLKANASYSEIAEWIRSGIEVKAVYGKNIATLQGSSAISDIATFDAVQLDTHTFSCISRAGNTHCGLITIEFQSDGSVYAYSDTFSFVI